MLQRAHWDDEAEVWVLERLSDTNPAAAFCRSSSSYYADSAASAAAGGGGGGGSRQGKRNKGLQQQGQQQQSLQGSVMPGSCRPIAVPGARRPTCNFTKAAALSGDMNTRFR